MQEPAKGRRRNRLGWIALLLLLAGGGVAAFLFRPTPQAPAPELASLDATVDKGRYLAKIGNCAACHTAAGDAPYAGGHQFQTPFGKLYSTNITSDAQHGIGGWSFAQFYNAMKYGERADGDHLYPAFPYSSFARMSDADIASIYLYMKTVKASPRPNQDNALDFPFNNRFLLYFWKKLFHDSAVHTADPQKSPAWNRGKYLVEGVAHCGACHTPRNFMGATKSHRALEGGAYVDKVASGEHKLWAAPDITPGPHGLAAWNEKDIVNYLTTGKNRHAIVHGPMNGVVASTAGLEPDDAAAIAEYLKGKSPGARRIDWPSFGGRAARGEIVYTVHCGTCHLPDGEGDKILGVSLAGNALVQAAEPASLINVILYGPDLPPPPFDSNRTVMKPFGKRLSDEDIAALATYLRGSFGNIASAVSPDQVRQQR
ncbi:c-type cytochrome [Parasphingorhabdus sp.]|uniref:c-type cytochrome n=1 Tax=Parasphingorhabdus sp. TaxID=2709688 RepID=UPI003A9113CF